MNLRFSVRCTVAAIVTMVFMTLSSNATPKAPDFAFPLKVEKAAASDIEKALKQNDAQGLTHAVIRYALAKQVVSADSAGAVLTMVSDLAARPDIGVAAPLLRLVEAEVINGRRVNSNLSRSDAPAGVYDYSNLEEWGKLQYDNTILGLCSQALAYKDLLKSIPLGDFKTVLDFDKDTAIYYPTLYDFAVYKVISLVQQLLPYGDFLSRELALSPSNTALYPSNQPLIRFILDAFSGLIDADTGNGAVILALGQREEFILQRVFNRYDSEENLEDSAFMKLFNQHYADPFAGLLLVNISRPQEIDRIVELHTLATDWLEENRNSPVAEMVEGYIKQLEQPEATIAVQPQVAKGVPFNAVVKIRNLENATLALYDLSGLPASTRERLYRFKGLAHLKPLATHTLSSGKKLPSEAIDTIAFTIDKYGQYAVALQGNDDNNVVKFICSDIAATASGQADDALLQAVDPRTGKPLSGIKFRYASSRNNTNVFTTAEATSAEGILKTTFPNSGNVTPVNGDDRWSEGLYIRDMRGGDDSRVMASLFTSLGLYRPGDKMEFSLLAFETSKEGNHLLPNRRFEVALLGVNWDVIEKQTLTTDAFGRVSGSFTLPAEGLQGDYHLRASLPGGRTSVTKNFVVSDYKLPTFEVEITSVVRPDKADSPAVIKGRAMAYSGFPIGNASVELQLTVRTSRWWWGENSPVFYQAKTTTAATGEFEIVIPGDVIASSPCPTGYFNAEIAVKAENGETCDNSAGFMMGNPCAINIAVPSIVTSDNVRSASIAVQTADTAIDEAKVMLRYNIYAIATSPYSEAETGRTLVKSGEIQPGDISPLLEKLSQGRYSLEVAPVDESLADKAKSQSFVIYDSEEANCPVSALLWTPEREIIAGLNGVATLPLYTSEADVTAIVSLWGSDGKLQECRTLSLSIGKNMLEFPVGLAASLLKITAVKEFHRSELSIILLPEAAREKIRLEISSFRDKVLPSAQEEISLKVIPEGRTAATSALWLNMSSRAINALQPNLLSFRAPGYYAPSVGVSTTWFEVYPRAAWSSVGMGYIKAATFPTPPAFNLYGLSFSGHRLMIRGSHKFAARSAAAGAVFDDAVESVMVEEYAAPVMMSAKMDYKAENAVATADETVADEDGGVSPAERSQPDISYRPSEIPLAFFRADLQTAADGTLIYSYRVPDANTSWLLQALAVNENLLSATTSATITASKPVMVNINRPRFLRCGDRLELAASIMNNSADSALTVGRLEILDALSLKPLTAVSDTLQIASMGAKLMRIGFVAPDTVAGVILRASAVIDNYSDGEQVYIPILPSAQNVVESNQFFIPSDSRSFEMQLPQIQPGDRAVLRFNENPVWEVVSALPGLAAEEMESSLAAASALFSASVADGLLRRYPSLRAALRMWEANPQDSVLVSNLQKDVALKQTLLSSTPWVADALDETQQKQRLILLLGKNNTGEAIENAVARLIKLRVNGGGWSWTSAYPTYSAWVTASILLRLGELNRLGFLPDDAKLAPMVEEALKRIDADAVKNYTNNPKGDFTSYCYLVSLFPAHKPSTAAQRVINAGIQQILRNWRDDAPVRKAADALILHRNGYNATARQVIASLRELATSTPERGMWWAQLDRPGSGWTSLDKVGATALILNAFSTVEPSAADIEQIRRWLILNKTNNNWGGSAATSMVVASILGSGNPPELANRTTAIHIGDRLVDPAEAERVTGSFSVDVSSLLAKPQILRIDRQVDYPSFGAVMLLRTLPMSEIRSVSCSSLSVEKQLTVYRDGQWTPADNFSAGDRIKVVLTLRVTDDMEYVVINDPRAAALEPASQLPEPVYASGATFYRENRDSATILYIDRLRKGVYRIEYELFASQDGSFSYGAAQAQSLYNPAVSAHSAAGMVIVD